MPYPGIGNSFTGWFVFDVGGPSGNVGANNYADVSLAIPQLPQLVQGVAQYVLAQAPSVQAASPQLMISYVWLIDPTHIGVRWMNTTGGNVSLPSASYSILVFV